ncbi:MAG TPA: helix-turn-helix transcriptional regulator [Spongiibacteraceae bacterium]|nr:helix-turn-helix transcriptional regulator [Spongiibacteraceae bacterium]
MPFSDLRYQKFDRTALPVTALAEDYADGHVTPAHRHPNAQLIHAVRGVMVVSTDSGQWIVPPTRGLWIPPAIEHSTRMVGAVQMRTAFIRPDAVPDLPTICAVLKISSLLRELILATIEIAIPYTQNSRAGHVVQLLIDEIQQLPSLPLHLPLPTDARLRTICTAIGNAPHDNTTVTEWARHLQIDPKTIQRLFLRETGMTFGQWRTQARLLIALERLAAGVRVLDIALDLGYESPTAFTTMFKKQFGVSPSRFFE